MGARGIDSPSELARRSGVPQPTVWRIFRGESRNPEIETLRKLAAALHVSISELIDHIAEPISAGYDVERDGVPLISWVRAGRWLEAVDNFHMGDAEKWLPCPVAHGKRAYALRVRGDSMDSGDQDGYRDGDLIFLDPERQWQHNDDVVVRTADGNVTFKRMQSTPDGNFLLALNEHYPERIQRVPEDAVVCGVVIFSGRERRR